MESWISLLETALWPFGPPLFPKGRITRVMLASPALKCALPLLRSKKIFPKSIIHAFEPIKEEFVKLHDEFKNDKSIFEKMKDFFH
jgi:hypothetical protein